MTKYSVDLMLQDSQMDWESKMEPSVAIFTPSWDISHLKDGICISIWSTKTLLYDIGTRDISKTIWNKNLKQSWRHFLGHPVCIYQNQSFWLSLFETMSLILRDSCTRPSITTSYLAFFGAIVNVISTEFTLATTLLVFLLTMRASLNHRFLVLVSQVKGSNCLMPALQFSLPFLSSFKANPFTLGTVGNL